MDFELNKLVVDTIWENNYNPVRLSRTRKKHAKPSYLSRTKVRHGFKRGRFLYPALKRRVLIGLVFIEIE